MSEETKNPASDKPASSNRGQRYYSPAFKEFITKEWGPRPPEATQARPVARYAAARRAAVSAKFPGDRLVFPAGPLKQRSNDTDYQFRPHTAFAHLTGLGRDEEPDAVLVLEPTDTGHEAILFFRPMAERDNDEFYSDARYGELWVGARPTLADLAVQLDVTCQNIADFPDHVAKNATEGTQVRVIAEADPAITDLVRAARTDDETLVDDQLAVVVSELRLVKDEYEIDQMRQAVAATHKGFNNVIRNMGEALRHHRGERVVETSFGAIARQEGNGVGYDIIAAAGHHACTLHWIRNDGPVRDGELTLIDAGVEMDSLYTADITRTLPNNGTFTPIQEKVYQAVLDAADAAFAAVKPGVTFKSIHEAAIKVIAERVIEWGLLDCTLAETLDADEGGFHRRWMVHGTSHHLGMDVHDCAQARKALYADAELREGMIFTIEPGLYFKEDDLSVPEEYRGIGIRIEDNILVTADGCESLSIAIPRTVQGVQEWMQSLTQ